MAGYSDYPYDNLLMDTSRFFIDSLNVLYDNEVSEVQEVSIVNEVSNFQTVNIVHELSCQLCGFTAKNKIELKNHAFIHSGAKVFSCTICDHKSLFKGHLENHMFKRHFKCRKCDFIGRDRIELETHYTIHPKKNPLLTAENVFSCTMCDHKALRKGHLENHMLKQHFKCKKCDFIGTDMNHLETHFIVHSNKNPALTGENVLSCALCDHKSLHKGHLENHMFKRHFKCKKCDFVGKDREQLEAHYTVHPKKIVVPRGEKVFCCTLCNHKSPVKGHLAHHMFKRHLKCKKCEFVGKDKEQLEIHIKVHPKEIPHTTGEKIFPCTLCDHKSPHKGHLENHMFKRHFKCNKCDFVGENRDLLKTHYSIHPKKKALAPGERIFSCTICDHKSSIKGQLENHMFKAHFKCKKCNFIGEDEESLDKHYTVHVNTTKKIPLRTNGKVFSCTICDHKSLHKGHLKTHMFKTHLKCKRCEFIGEDKEQLKEHWSVHAKKLKYQCAKCDYACNQNNSLIIHMWNKHDEDNFNCPVCDYEGNNKFELNRHFLTHRIDQEFKCPKCDYKSPKKNHLKLHFFLIHAEENQLKCTKCDYKSSGKLNMKSHMIQKHNIHSVRLSVEPRSTRRHPLKNNSILLTGENVLKCTNCNNEFSHKDELEDHMIIHLGEEPFICYLCGYGTKDKTSLERHFLSHTGEDEFRCTICDFKFLHKKHLVKHMFKQHLIDSNVTSLEKRFPYS